MGAKHGGGVRAFTRRDEEKWFAVVRPEEVEVKASRCASSGYLGATGWWTTRGFKGALESLRVRLENGAQPPLSPAEASARSIVLVTRYASTKQPGSRSTPSERRHRRARVHVLPKRM